MIGDTLTSDILGANNAGIDSCLVDIKYSRCIVNIDNLPILDIDIGE